MLVSEIKKDLLIINDQPDLMLAISQLDSEEGIAEVVWSMAVFDFNNQKIIMAAMDYSAAATHLLELCKCHSDSVGLEGHWHILAGFSSIGMSSLDIENYQSPNTQVQVLIDNENREEPMALAFHAIGMLIKSV